MQLSLQMSFRYIVKKWRNFQKACRLNNTQIPTHIYICCRYFLKEGHRMNDNPCCQSMIQTFLIIFNCIAFVRSFNHDFFNVLVSWRYWISIKSLLSTHYPFLLSIQTLLKKGWLKIKSGYIFSKFFYPSVCKWRRSCFCHLCSSWRRLHQVAPHLTFTTKQRAELGFPMLSSLLYQSSYMREQSPHHLINNWWTIKTALRSLLPDGLPDSVAQLLFDNEGNSFQVR